jgi:hypothetical protein
MRTNVPKQYENEKESIYSQSMLHWTLWIDRPPFVIVAIDHGVKPSLLIDPPHFAMAVIDHDVSCLQLTFDSSSPLCHTHVREHVFASPKKYLSLAKTHSVDSSLDECMFRLEMTLSESKSSQRRFDFRKANMDKAKYRLRQAM